MKLLLKLILISVFGVALATGSACTGFGPADVQPDVVPDSVDPLDNGKIPDVGVDVTKDTTVRDIDGDDSADSDTIEPPDQGMNDEGTVELDVVPDDVVPDMVDDTVLDVITIDTLPETDACIPNCGVPGNLYECGSDGCGGECGYCDYGEVCNIADHKCKTICIPDCLEKGKACGDDGCNGNCGDCGINYICGIDFQCHPDVCVPDCVEMGKECGDDGCGGSCGECGESRVCTVGGKCSADACYGVDLERNTCSLDGRYLYICNVGPPQSLLQIDCYVQTGAECGERGCDCHFNTWSGMNECLEKPPCVPDCEGKECGDDGCGGLCITSETNSQGLCDGGWACTHDFRCRPFEGADCVWIGWAGTCWEDNWLYSCSSDTTGGEIMAEDCTASGKICCYKQSIQQMICATSIENCE